MNVPNSAVIIANCHCLPIADALALCSTALNTDFIDVNFVTRPEMVVKIEKVTSQLEQSLVISQVLSERFEQLATTTLKTLYGEKLITFTNVHFSGLHPDITYLGPMGSRIAGFFGDYHSKLVLFAYVNRRSIDECLQLFNSKTYEAIGYFSAFEESANSLRQRDDLCDVKFAETFVSMTLNELTMYSTNHPTGAVFLELAKAIAQVADVEFIPYPANSFQNHLSNSFIWPVYNEIAEYNGLKYRSAQYFVHSASRKGRSSSFRTFIEGSYAAYEKANLDEFNVMVTKLPFYASFAESI